MKNNNKNKVPGKTNPGTTKQNKVSKQKYTQDELNEKIGYSKSYKNWISLKIEGDVTALQNITGFSQPYVSKAINTGTGSLTVLRAVSSYYAKRAKIMREIAENEEGKTMFKN